MTKDEIFNEVQGAINTALSEVEPETTLTQGELTICTNAAAIALDTVNPNGPHYPSTPR